MSGLRWTDCGDAECPECRETIALQRLAEHQRAVERTVLPGQMQTDGTPRPWPSPPRASARASRAKAREERRVRRVLTPEQRTEALELLRKYPLRKMFRDQAGGRLEWTAEVWLELEHPTVLVASREGNLTLQRKVAKAVQRAQFGIRERRRAESREISVEGLGEK